MANPLQGFQVCVLVQVLFCRLTKGHEGAFAVDDRPQRGRADSGAPAGDRGVDWDVKLRRTLGNCDAGLGSWSIKGQWFDVCRLGPMFNGLAALEELCPDVRPLCLAVKARTLQATAERGKDSAWSIRSIAYAAASGKKNRKVAPPSTLFSA